MSIINREQAYKPRRMPDNPKPVLDIYRVPVFRVHHTKLEAYIKKVFGFEFDFLHAAGVTEGQCVEYLVDGTLPTTQYEQRAHDLRIGRKTKDVNLILAVLAKDGYIPKGHYTVSTHPLPNDIVLYTELIHKTKDTHSPECLAFKAARKGDAKFTERSATLDKVWQLRFAAHG